MKRSVPRLRIPSLSRNPLRIFVCLLLVASQTCFAQAQPVDTDRDTFPDGEEVASGTDPLNPASNLRKASREYTAIEIEFATVVGKRYQMQAYTANRTWENIGSVVQGTGQKSKAMLSTRSVTMKLWRVVLVP